MVGQHLGQGRQHAGPIGQAVMRIAWRHGVGELACQAAYNAAYDATMNRTPSRSSCVLAGRRCARARAAAAQGQPTCTDLRSRPRQAKNIAAAAIAEAKKNHWTMAIAIVDTPAISCTSSGWTTRRWAASTSRIAKARSAARFKRPTKVFQDALAAGGEGWRILSLEGAVPIEGGVPLVSAARSSAPSARPAAPASRTASPPPQVPQH